jgi:predicted amidophosphoribosyltransferase
MLAHQGGWDEMLIAGAVVLVMLGISRFRRRRAPTPPRERRDDLCAYCGAALEPSETRCPSCGYRRGEVVP